MYRFFFILTVVIRCLAMNPLLLAQSHPEDPGSTIRQIQIFRQAYFIENQGQLNNPEIKYYASFPNVDIGFAPGKIYFNIVRWREIEPQNPFDDPEWIFDGGLMYDLKIGNGDVSPQATDILSGYSNFFLGKNPQTWRTHVPHYNRIVYKDVYPGIDLTYFFDEHNQLTYEYLVSPYADVSPIELKFDAVKDILSVDSTQIKILTDMGEMKDGELVCYQMLDGIPRLVASTFRKTGKNSYRVELLDNYDHSRPLTIDPTVAFSTYWGTGPAQNRTVVIDSAGNIYMSGGTRSTDWPVTPGAYDTVHSGTGWQDVVSAKFDSNGNVIWSTFIGGPKEDYAYVSAVNGSGELYLAGRAGTGFPTTPGAFDNSFNGGHAVGNVHTATDAFVAKLSPAGDQLLYSTYIGGNGNDNGRAIHLLPSGELIIGGGNSDSDNLPVTPGAYKTSLGGQKDSWVAKLSADGSSLIFLTYFGPNNDNQGDETIRALGVDASGNIWIGGTTGGTDFVTTPDAFQPIRGGGISEAYIAKLSSDGTSLIYLSWLGGSGFDEIETEGVVDSQGNFYVVGSTASPDFPTTPGAFQSTLRGGGNTFDGDGWVARINNDGTLGMATLYGGSNQGPEGFFGPVVDAAGNVYCTGRVQSNDCPITPDAFQSQYGGVKDAIIAIFSPDGTQLLYGSYCGGSEKDFGRHIGIHPNSSAIYIIGETFSNDFPLVNAPQTTPGGAFLAKLDLTTDGLPGGDNQFPDQFQLYQNYPNPFNASTIIKYYLPESSQVNLTIVDLLGQEVQSLVNGWQSSGVHQVTFNAEHLNSGVYFYQLHAGDFTTTRKMILLK